MTQKDSRKFPEKNQTRTAERERQTDIQNREANRVCNTKTDRKQTDKRREDNNKQQQNEKDRQTYRTERQTESAIRRQTEYKRTRKCEDSNKHRDLDRQ